MKRTGLTYIALALIAASLFSCKKKEAETLPTLNGQINLFLPAFVTAGETFDIELGGPMLKSTVHRNEAGGIGYYFYNSQGTQRDTARLESQPLTDPVRYTLTCGDQLGAFTLTCSAFAQKYYNVSDVATLNLIDPAPGKSLTGFEQRDADLVFADSRDGREYRAARIGGLYWMRQNLAWEGAGRAYLSSLREFGNPGTSAISTIMGRFYSWDEAVTACPEGWELPSPSDWTAMVAAVSGKAAADDLADIDGVAGALMGKDLKLNGKALWQYWRGVERTDASALSLMPGGYALNTVPGLYSFHGNGSYAMLWTSGERDGHAVYRYVNEKFPILYCGLADKKSFCIPVRCVKSAE
ncbi:MAG: hypothetical protein IJS62_02455 [Bacteroidales bacterium]|nr:hypothetical protein [Bacteroidales bacterium]